MANRETAWKEYPTAPGLRVIDTLPVPHPYCLTPKHVEVAADHHCGMLGKAAIEDAEKRGARCGMKGCRLKRADHGTACLVEVDAPELPKDLNLVPGLHAYLLVLKPPAERDGYAGFGFVPKKR